jgi:hypothetical protein
MSADLKSEVTAHHRRIGKGWRIPLALAVLLLGVLAVPLNFSEFNEGLKRRPLASTVDAQTSQSICIANSQEGGGSVVSDAGFLVAGSCVGDGTPETVFVDKPVPLARLAAACGGGECRAWIYRGSDLVPTMALRAVPVRSLTASGPLGVEVAVQKPEFSAEGLFHRIREDVRPIWMMLVFVFLAALALGGRRYALAGFMVVPVIATLPFLWAVGVSGIVVGGAILSALIFAFAILGFLTGRSLPRQPAR